MVLIQSVKLNAAAVTTESVWFAGSGLLVVKEPLIGQGCGVKQLGQNGVPVYLYVVCCAAETVVKNSANTDKAHEHRD